MDGEQRTKFPAVSVAQIFFYLNGIKIERGRFDVRKDGSRPGSHNGTGGSKETERRSENLIARLNAGGNQGQPQGVGPGRAADGFPCAAEIRDLALERFHLGTQNVLLGSAYPSDSAQDLSANLLILALQVKHGHGAGRS